MSGTAITSQKAAWLIERAKKTPFGAPARIKQRAIVVDVEAYAKEIDARLASASSCATRGLALFRGSLSCLGTR